MELKKVLENASCPTLAAALGGPFNAYAIQCLASNLGCTATEEGLVLMLRAGTPDQYEAVRRAEAEFATSMGGGLMVKLQHVAGKVPVRRWWEAFAVEKLLNAASWFLLGIVCARLWGFF